LSCARGAALRVHGSARYIGSEMDLGYWVTFGRFLWFKKQTKLNFKQIMVFKKYFYISHFLFFGADQSQI